MANDVIREQMQHDCCFLVPSLNLISRRFFLVARSPYFEVFFAFQNDKQELTIKAARHTYSKRSPETGQNNFIVSVTVSI